MQIERFSVSKQEKNGFAIAGFVFCELNVSNLET